MADKEKGAALTAPHAREGERSRPDLSSGLGPPSRPFPFTLPLKPRRLRCAICTHRWTPYAGAPEDLPTACPNCRSVDIHQPEPVDSGWWAAATGMPEADVEAAILAEIGRLPAPTPTTKPPPRPPKPPKLSQPSPLPEEIAHAF